MPNKGLIYCVRAFGYIIILCSIIIFLGNFFDGTHLVILLPLISWGGTQLARFKERDVPYSKVASMFSNLFCYTAIIIIIIYVVMEIKQSF